MSEEALLTQDGLLNAVDRRPSHELPFVGIHEKDYLKSRRKRVVDVVGATLILALVLPLLAFFSFLIVTTSRGSATFKQFRYGRNKTVFRVYKLRSMRVAGNVRFKQAVRRDTRVTWIGRFIRKTSIDELPQLLNVLKGEMSLVGPRPHPVELDDMYAPWIVGYDTRFQALPGITGLAQVSGARGATPTIDHMRRRIELDLHYVREASLALDLKILSMTAKALFFSLSDDNAF